MHHKEMIMNKPHSDGPPSEAKSPWYEFFRRIRLEARRLDELEAKRQRENEAEQCSSNQCEELVIPASTDADGGASGSDRKRP